MDKQRLYANIFYMLLMQAGNYLIPLLTFPYLTRTLGINGFGEFSFAFAVVAYIALITDWGFTLSATGEVARHRDDPGKVSEIFWNVITAKLILISICLVILGSVVLSIASARTMAPLMFAAVVGTFAGALTTNWCLQGLERLGSFALAATVGKALTVPATLILVKDSHDVWLAILIQSLGSCVAAISSIILLRRLNVIGRIKIDAAGAFAQIRKGWYLFISSAAVNIYTSTNSVVLGVIGGTSEIAIYSVADRLRMASQSLIAPVSQAVYPYSSRLITENTLESELFSRKLLIVQGVITGTISLSVYLFAPYIVPIVAGPNFHQAILILQIMSPLPFLVGISNVLGIQMMLPNKMEAQFSTILARAAALNIALVVPLTWYYNARGTAVGSVVSEMYVSVAMFVVLRSRGFRFLNSQVRHEI